MSDFRKSFSYKYDPLCWVPGDLLIGRDPLDSRSLNSFLAAPEYALDRGYVIGIVIAVNTVKTNIAPLGSGEILITKNYISNSVKKYNYLFHDVDVGKTISYSRSPTSNIFVIEWNTLFSVRNIKDIKSAKQSSHNE